MDWVSAQFRALGRQDLPEQVEVDGETFRLSGTFKHTFAAAVGLYERGGELVVCKFHRQATFFGIPLHGIGRLMSIYEAAVMRRCKDLPGVPRLRLVDHRTAMGHDFIPGHPLERDTKVDDDFFPRFLELLRGMHERGVAYVDLEKPGNILLGDDGHPWLIDFQVAFYVPQRLFGETTLVRWLRGVLQRADIYHAMKHYRRVRPDLLGREGVSNTRFKPLSVRLGNALVAPYKLLTRRVMGKD